jgi:hypothetical protein
MKITHHPAPSPTLYRVQQSLAAVLLALIVLASSGLFVLALLISAPLMVLMAVLLAMLAAPVIMLLSISPPLTLDDEGFTLQPFWGKEQRIAWADIESMRVYPLLPQPDQEVERRLVEGRKRYRAAEGYMLLIPRLPWRYRAGGFFAGLRGQSIVALTNRSHSDYDTLIQRVQAHIKNKDL